MDKAQENTAKDAAKAALDAGRDAAETAARDTEALADAGEDAGRRGAAAMREGVDRMEAGAEQMADHAADLMATSADYSRSMAQGMQAIAAEWVECSRSLMERAMTRMTALGQARNPFDLIGAQRDLFTGGLQDLLTAQQRISRVSIDVAAQAAQKATRAPAPLAA